MRNGLAALSLAGAFLALAPAVQAFEAAETTPSLKSASADTSIACFNAGFLNTGSTVDYDEKISGDASIPQRRYVLEVLGPERFHGVDAVETRIASYTGDGKVTSRDFRYERLIGGFLVSYGSAGRGWTRQSRPPLQIPVALARGDTYKAKFELVTFESNGQKLFESGKFETQFKGFEILFSKLGKVKTCRFENVYSAKSEVRTLVTRSIEWVAAEGKYRGFLLKSKTSAKFSDGGTHNQRNEVTKIRRFEMR